MSNPPTNEPSGHLDAQSPSIGSDFKVKTPRSPIATTSINPDKIIVAGGADESYAMYLAVTLFSLISHLARGSEIEIYILGLGLSEASKTKFRKALQVDDVQITLHITDFKEADFADFPELGHITVATYLRLFLPTVIPEHYHKVLYLDSDLLIRKDIRELWNRDVEDNYLLAAQDFVIPTVSSFGGVVRWKEIGMPADAIYFNAGVLLLNLQKWRIENLAKVLIQYILDFKDQIIYLDQEALNAVCYPDWGIFDLTWNVPSLHLGNLDKWPASPFKDYVSASYNEIYVEPSICHFTTKKKPWVPGYRVPFQREWFNALRNSGWFSPAEYTRYRLIWTVQHYWIGAYRKLFRVE